MSVSQIGQKYYQNYATENKGVNSTEKFALEETNNTKELEQLLIWLSTYQKLERSRLEKAWSSGRQIAKVSNAYNANVMTETAVHPITSFSDMRAGILVAVHGIPPDRVSYITSEFGNYQAKK